MKNLYKGIFQNGCKIRKMYAYATSEAQAKLIMCHRMAKKDGIPVWQVQQYFKDGKFAINLEMEFKEVLK